MTDKEIRNSTPLFSNLVEIPKSPKELQIIPCSVHRACELNKLWHSRFPITDWTNIVRNKDYICFIAEKDGIAYASAIWSSPVARKLNDGHTLELRRLAIAPDAPKYTATRMLKIMRGHIKTNLPHISKLISYQDTEAHKGTIYKAQGWTPTNQSRYVSWSNKTRTRATEQSTADKIRWETKP